MSESKERKVFWLAKNFHSGEYTELMYCHELNIVNVQETFTNEKFLIKKCFFQWKEFWSVEFLAFPWVVGKSSIKKQKF